jgi:DNA mismatch repair protein MutS
VLDRATTLLRHFEKLAPREGRLQLSLFGAGGTEPQAVAPPPDALRDALDALDPDTLAPREALAALYQLKALR